MTHSSCKIIILSSKCNGNFEKRKPCLQNVSDLFENLWKSYNFVLKMLWKIKAQFCHNFVMINPSYKVTILSSKCDGILKKETLSSKFIGPVFLQFFLFRAD